MDKKLEDILSEALAPELKEQLQEAFNKKVEDMEVSVEESVRAELSNRYEHDKAQLVEAMDRMLSDVIRVQEETKAGEITKLKETRGKIEETHRLAKAAFRKQISKMADTSGKLINESLAKEITALRDQRVAISNKAESLTEDVAAVKMRLTENHAKHLAKINEFITRQLTKEMMEFTQDKKALVEARVKLISESKQKIADTQKAFIREAARKVEDTVKSTLKREMTQLHEDLEQQRQNSFGRRMFEAFAAEFQTSYLAEGTEIRKLQKVVESKDQEIAAAAAKVNAAQVKLNEAAQAREVAERKIVQAETRVERTKIMSELMSNLKGDKRAVMESMLETTKTSQLRQAFNKLLPVVLNEGSRKSVPTGKKVLTEGSETSTTVTGDRAGRLITETREESQNNEESAAIVRLAGIRK